MNSCGAEKKMIKVIVISSLIIIAAGAVYYRSLSVLPFAVGVFLMAALNVFKIIMLGRTIERAISMEEKKAGSFIRFQHLLRFLLTGLVLVIAAKTPFISLWGAAAGIFTLQIAAYYVSFFERDEKTGISS
ncbi:MAG: hypothetical protein FWE49_03175 [Synergistaceae bacterium]|nr:hypothetical protein [Synergistaceae bacterium]